MKEMNILINGLGMITLFFFFPFCMDYKVLASENVPLGAMYEDSQTHVWSVVAVGLLCMSERVLKTIKDAEQISCDEKD